MGEGAISREALLSGLADLRLPATSPGGLLAEAMAALALGLVLALILGAVLRLATVRRAGHAPQTLSDRIETLSALDPEARRVALLHLLRAEAPERHAALADRLYRPGAGLETSEIEALLRRHA